MVGAEWSEKALTVALFWSGYTTVYAMLECFVLLSIISGNIRKGADSL
jgi:hypothetical protein